MAVEVFKLFGSIFVDNSEANNSLSKTEKNAGSVASTLGKGVKTAAKFGAAMVGGASAAAGGMLKMATNSASTADNIDKMSQKIGVSRQAYQELDFICSQTGTSVDKLKGGMKNLRSAMANDKNAEVFKSLGVAVTDANGKLRNSEDVMWDTMSALQGITDENEKAALAQKLFGKTGQELMPLLNSQSGSIAEMKDKAHELGLVMSDELIDSGVGLTDSLDQIKRSFSAITTKLGGAFMPIVQQVADLIISNMPQIQSLIDGITPILADAFDKIMPPLMSMAEAIFPVIINLLATLMPVLANAASAILPVIVNIITTLAPIFARIATAILPVIVSIIQQLAPFIAQIAETVLPIIAEAIETLLPIFEEIIQTLLPVLMEAFEQLAPIFAQIIEELLPVFVELIELLLPIIVQIIQEVLPVVLEIIQQLMPFIIQIVQQVLPIFLQIIQQLMPFILQIVQTVLPVILQIVQAILPIFLQIAQTILPIVVKFLEKLLPPLLQLVESVLPIIQSIFEAISPLLQTLAETILPIISTVLEALSPILQLLADLLSGVLGEAIENVTTLLQPLTDILNGIITFIKNIFQGNWEEAWNGIVDAFKGILNLLPSAIEAVINGIIWIINQMIGGINWVIQIFGWEIGTIPDVHLPRFRAGIDYVPNDKYLAYLDAGEAVLTASEAEEYRKAKQENGTGSPFATEPEQKTINQTFNVTVNVEKVNDRFDINELASILSEKLAEEVRRTEGVYA